MRQFNTLAGAISSTASNPTIGDTIEITSTDGSAAVWAFRGTVGQTINQSPAQLGNALFNDGSGNQWSAISGSDGNVTPKTLGAKVDGVTDDSLAAAAFSNYCGSLASSSNGFTGLLNSGVMVLQGFNWPAFTSFKSEGKRSSVLKLKDNATDHLMYPERWDQNINVASGRQSLKGLTLDGNKANQTGQYHNLIVYNYQTEIDIISKFSSGNGILFTDETRNLTLTTTNMSEVDFSHCRFEQNDLEGLKSTNAANKIADGNILNCVFNANGASGDIPNISIDRFAGWKMTGNQLYGAGGDDTVLLNADRCVITGNHFDLDGVNVVSGEIHALKITNAGSEAVNISNNIFFLDGTLTGATIMNAIGLNGPTISGYTLTGNNSSKRGGFAGNTYMLDNFNGSALTVNAVSTGNNKGGLTAYTKGAFALTAGD